VSFARGTFFSRVMRCNELKYRYGTNLVCQASYLFNLYVPAYISCLSVVVVHIIIYYVVFYIRVLCKRKFYMTSIPFNYRTACKRPMTIENLLICAI